MASFEQRLPEMVVSINEAGREDLVSTVDDFSTLGGDYAFLNLADDVSLDQNVGLDGMHMVISIVGEDSASSE
jgi:hypothetical protein